jgi:hypothetical protein
MRRKKYSSKGGAQTWRREGGGEELTRAWKQKLGHGEAVLARP